MPGTPLLFTPYTVRGLKLANRVVMSPMCQYRTRGDGLAHAWHRVHYGARAVGGVGLIVVEATGVLPEGRITVGDLGLWEDAQADALREIVDFAHSLHTPIGIQISHAGRKAELPDPVGPSPVPFAPDWKTPRPLTVGELDGVVEAFARAARRAVAVGFDCLEVHAAHGYLLHQFLSPLSNRREDAYGADPEGRARLLREVLAAVRAELPAAMPLFLRISATDWHDGGLTPAQFRPLLPSFVEAGVDVLDVSSGGLIPQPPPAVYPGYQVPLAEELAHPALARMAIGILEYFPLAENTLRRGAADLIALGRGLLRDPYWPLRTAREHGLALTPPAPYERAW